MTTPEEIRDIIRRHHVHFDVAMSPPHSDAALGVDGRMALRLFAVHQKGARALPGCAQCRALIGDLRSLAHFVFRSSDVTVVEEATRPALYDSAIVPGADEIALELTINVLGDGRPEAPGFARGPRQVRTLLQQLGIPER